MPSKKAQSTSTLVALALLAPVVSSAQLVVTGQNVYASASAGSSSQVKVWDALTSANVSASASSSGSIVLASASANAQTRIEADLLSINLSTGASTSINTNGYCPYPCNPGSGSSASNAAINVDFSLLSATDVAVTVQDSWASGRSSTLALYKKSESGQVAVVDRALLGTLTHLDAGDYALKAGFGSSYSASMTGGGGTGGGFSLSIKMLPSAVPEPTSLAMMVLGLTLMANAKRRHREAMVRA